MRVPGLAAAATLCVLLILATKDVVHAVGVLGSRAGVLDAATTDTNVVHEMSTTCAAGADLQAVVAADGGAAVGADVGVGTEAPGIRRFNCPCNSRGACTGTVFRDTMRGRPDRRWQLVSGRWHWGRGGTAFSNSRHYGPVAVINLGKSFANYRVRLRMHTCRGGGGIVWRYRSMSAFFSDFYWGGSRCYISLDGREGTYIDGRHWHHHNGYDMCATVTDNTKVALALGACDKPHWGPTNLPARYQGGLTGSTYVGIATHSGSWFHVYWYHVTAKVLPVVHRDPALMPVTVSGGARVSQSTAPGFNPRDSAPLRYTLTGQPGWLAVGASSGVVTGRAPANTMAVHRFVVRAAGSQRFHGGTIGCATAEAVTVVYPRPPTTIPMSRVTAGAEAGVSGCRWAARGYGMESLSNAGRFQSESSMAGCMAVFDPSMLDYTYNVLARSGDDDVLGVVFRYMNANAYMMVSWGGGDVDGSNLRLLVHKGSTKKQLWGTQRRRVRNRWYHFRIVAADKTFTFYLDGVRMARVTNGDVPGGGVGMYTLANPTQFAYLTYEVDNSRLARFQGNTKTLQLAASKLKAKSDSLARDAAAARRAAEAAAALLPPARAVEAGIVKDANKLKAMQSSLDIAVKGLLQALARAKARLAAVSAAAKKRLAAANSDLAATRAAATKRAGDVEAATKSYLAAVERLKAMVAAAAAAQKALSDGKVHVALAKEKMAQRERELHEEVAAAEKDKKDMASKVDAVRASLDPIRKELGTTNTLVSTARAGTETAQRQMEASQQELQQYGADAADARTRLNDQKSRLSTETQANRDTLHEMSSQIGPLRAKVRELRQAAEAAEEAAEHAAGATAAAKEQRDEAQRKTEVMLKDKRGVMVKLQADVEVEKHTAADLGVQASEVKAKLEDVQAQLVAEDNRRTQLRKDAEGMEDVRMKGDAQVHGLAGRVAELHAAGDEEAAREDAVRHEVKLKQKALRTLAPAAAVASALTAAGQPPPPAAVQQTSLTTPSAPLRKVYDAGAHPVYQALQAAQRTVGPSTADAAADAARRQVLRDAAGNALLNGGVAPGSGSGPVAVAASGGEAAAVAQAAAGVALGLPQQVQHTATTTTAVMSHPQAAAAVGADTPQGAHVMTTTLSKT